MKLQTNFLNFSKLYSYINLKYHIRKPPIGEGPEAMAPLFSPCTRAQ